MIRVVAVPLLLAMSPPLLAAPRCAPDANVVRAALCADPALGALRVRLSAAYRAALQRNPAQAAAIRADQRNWYAQRDDHVWLAARTPGALQADVAPEVQRRYRERIAFLDGLGNAARTTLAAAVLNTLTTQPYGGEGPDVRAALQQTGLLEPAWERSAPGVDAKRLVAELPARPGPKLLTGLGQARDHGEAYANVAYLPDAAIGGVATTAGSAACRNWVLFRIQRGVAHLVATPATLREACRGPTSLTTTSIARLDGQPVAMRQTIDVLGYATDLRWQRWTGAAWSRPVEVVVRLGQKLEAWRQGVACAASIPTADCSEVRARILSIANRYARRPLPGTLDRTTALTPDERTRFTGMRAAAIAATPPGEPVPAFGTGLDKGSGGLSRETATFFPMHLDGSLVLGRIGHGNGGWRVLPNWLISLQGWQHGKLVPLVGAVIAPTVTGVLLASEVPATGPR